MRVGKLVIAKHRRIGCKNLKNNKKYTIQGKGPRREGPWWNQAPTLVPW
jgi:hypothetical protein